MSEPAPTPDVEALKKQYASLQTKILAAKEPFIRQALEEKAREIASQLGPAAVEALKEAEPAQPAAPVKTAKGEEDTPLPEPPTAEAQMKAEDLIRRSRLSKSRGQTQEATTLLQQAAGIAPGSASVQEALGDEMYERKRFGEARAAYLLAHRIAPSNAGIERKYAQMVLRTSLGMSAENALAGGDPLFLRPDETLASPKTANILNLFIPGVGQLALGETRKGLWLVGAYLASVLLTILFKDLPFFLIHNPDPKAPHISGLILFPLFAIVVIYGIAFAGTQGKVSSHWQPNRHTDRPVPPANLPFE